MPNAIAEFSRLVSTMPTGPALAPEELEYDARCCAYEAQGMTRSDAQAIVDAENMMEP